MEELVDSFDWALPEECVQYDECDAPLPFIEQDKAVFAVDYEDAADPAEACAAYEERGFDGLVKNEPLTSEFRESCGS